MACADIHSRQGRLSFEGGVLSDESLSMRSPSKRTTPTCSELSFTQSFGKVVKNSMIKRKSDVLSNLNSATLSNAGGKKKSNSKPSQSDEKKSDDPPEEVEFTKEMAISMGLPHLMSSSSKRIRRSFSSCSGRQLTKKSSFAMEADISNNFHEDGASSKQESKDEKISKEEKIESSKKMDEDASKKVQDSNNDDDEWIKGLESNNVDIAERNKMFDEI